MSGFGFMEKVEKVRWNPLVARLADAEVKQNFRESTRSENKESCDDDAPQGKYQNLDIWNVYPRKQKTNESVDS